MTKTRSLTAAIVALAAFAAPQAAFAGPTVTSSTAYGLPAITGPNVITFDENSAPYQISGNAAVVHGSVSGQYAAPATATGDDTTNYLAAFPANDTLASGSLFGFGLANAVTFYWGSIDSYNALDFFLGDTFLGSVLGSDVSLFPNGDQNSGITNRTVSIASSTPFDRLSFRTGQNSFEADSFRFSSAVPEPATWAMMIAGFGMMGFALRSARRRETSALA